MEDVFSSDWTATVTIILYTYLSHKYLCWKKMEPRKCKLLYDLKYEITVRQAEMKLVGDTTKCGMLLVTWLHWYGDRSRGSLLFVRRLLMVPAMKLWLVIWGFVVYGNFRLMLCLMFGLCMDTDAPSDRSRSPDSVLHSAEVEKKKYTSACVARRACFTPASVLFCWWYVWCRG